MKRYILTIDEGTTSLRAVLFDVKKQKIKRFERAFTKLIEPKPTWVEQDANDIWNKTIACLKKVMVGIKTEDVYGLGITNQRETVVAWDKKTGKALTNAIIWKCRRTAKYCQTLKTQKIAKTIQNKTGLLVNSYFSATKIKWMLENVPAVKKALKENRLCIGTIESYLVYRLTNCTVFVTDVTNASRTMLFNIKTLKWDEQLLKFFKVPKNILPRPVDNDKIVGFTSLLGSPIKIAGLIGDQQSSLLGQGCFHKGDIKNTYGTGCFMLANIGVKPIISKHNLLVTVANRLQKRTSYALEGSVFNGGSIINEMIKQGIAPDHRRLTRLAMKCRTSNVYLIPAFNGLGAPYWRMNAQAKFVNWNKDTKAKEIAKAAWEAIAFRNYDVYEALTQDIKLSTSRMCVDGGLSKNKYLMRLQSNLIQLPISIINLESTCMGSIICTGLATKAFKSLDDIKFKLVKTYYPKRTKNQMEEKIDGWKKTINQYLKGLK
ncbi:MAG: glycerol kinase GlpK [Mycoplasma sp.]|nr:glycerol kinase GlpK [Candidatus Hennigella equi]